jgi:hypothetical protein
MQEKGFVDSILMEGGVKQPIATPRPSLVENHCETANGIIKNASTMASPRQEGRFAWPF